MGYDRNGIWARNACRAEFVPGDPNTYGNLGGIRPHAIRRPWSVSRRTGGGRHVARTRGTASTIVSSASRNAHSTAHGDTTRGECGWTEDAALSSPSVEPLRSDGGPKAARIVAFVVVAAVVVVLDQWTKVLVREHVGAPRTYANGIVTLLRTENTGAFLSIGADLPDSVRTLVFGGFVAVMLVMFTIAVIHGSIWRRGDTVAAAMVIGGGFGNLLDRILRAGHVTDFLYLEAGPLHTGVFNVADMAITCGVVWLIVMMRTPAKEVKPKW